jgi:hypothetical protein
MWRHLAVDRSDVEGYCKITLGPGLFFGGSGTFCPECGRYGDKGTAIDGSVAITRDRRFLFVTTASIVRSAAIGYTAT